MNRRRVVLASGLGVVGALGLLWVGRTGPARRPSQEQGAPAPRGLRPVVPPAASPPTADADGLAMSSPRPRLFMEVRVGDLDEPVGVRGWSLPYFDSSHVGGPDDGWGGMVFVPPRRLDPPEWVEQGMTAMGVTPGILVEPLLWVDPWLAATAASADHRWAQRERRARWKAASVGLSAEERHELRAAFANDARENQHAALFRALAPEHEATSLVSLDELDASSWTNPFEVRSERIAFIRTTGNAEHAAAVAASLVGPVDGLAPEERRDAEALLGHEAPAVRGVMGLLVALDEAGEEGIHPGSRGLDVLEEAAERCRSSMGPVTVESWDDGSRIIHVMGDGDVPCSGVVSAWDDLRSQLADQVPIETWQDAVRRAAMECGRREPRFYWYVVVGSFDGVAWSWRGDLPLVECLEAPSWERLPPKALELELSMQDQRKRPTQH